MFRKYYISYEFQVSSYFQVDDKIRRKVNALSKHSNYTIVDKIFGGHLVSTIVCEQCHNSSQVLQFKVER
jgi:hypothetical protein